MMNQEKSNEELQEEIIELRKKIDKYQNMLEHNKGDNVDRGKLRGVMSRLNLLKIEARRRGLITD